MFKTPERGINPDIKNIVHQRSYWGVLGEAAAEYFLKPPMQQHGSCHLEFYRRFEALSCNCVIKIEGHSTTVHFGFPTEDDYRNTLKDLTNNRGNEISDILRILKRYSIESSELRH